MLSLFSVDKFKRSGASLSIGALLVVQLMLLPGCTAFREPGEVYRPLSHRTKFFERTEEAIQPTETWAQVVLFPVTLPLAYIALLGDITAFLIDGLVINPPRFFWRGVPTGYDWVWEKPVEGTPYRRSVFFTFRVLITPIAIPVACVNHALFTGLGEERDREVKREIREREEADQMEAKAASTEVGE